MNKFQACAGPGAAPPCLTVEVSGNTFLGSPKTCETWNSTYVDRDGHVFRGRAISAIGYCPYLEEVAEGDYVILLEDGRKLTGHLRVCLLEREFIA